VRSSVSQSTSPRDRPWVGAVRLVRVPAAVCQTAVGAGR